MPLQISREPFPQKIDRPEYGLVASKLRVTPAAVLLKASDAQLVPCSYQRYASSSDDNPHAFGTLYVPVGEIVSLETLEKVGHTSFSSMWEENDDFHDFLCNLLENPPPRVQHVIHEGTDRIIEQRESWNFWKLRIPKPWRKRTFVHGLSLWGVIGLT